MPGPVALADLIAVALARVTARLAGQEVERIVVMPQPCRAAPLHAAGSRPAVFVERNNVPSP